MITDPRYILLACVVFPLFVGIIALYINSGNEDKDRQIQKAVKPLADDDIRMATEEFYRDQQLAAWEEDNWPDAQDERRYRDDE